MWKELVPKLWPAVQLTAVAAARRFHKSSVTFYRIPHSARGCLRFSCCLAGARTHAPARHPEGLRVAAAQILLTRARRVCAALLTLIRWFHGSNVVWRISRMDWLWLLMLLYDRMLRYIYSVIAMVFFFKSYFETHLTCNRMYLTLSVLFEKKKKQSFS